MDCVDKTKHVLKFTSQLDVVGDTLWFTGRTKPVHALNEGLDLSFDLPTEM